MHSQLRKSQLPKLQDKLRSKNEKEKELEEHNNFHKWLRELENACEYIGKFSPLQLRACHKVRHHLTLQNRDRTEKNFDNEHPMNNDSKNELQEEFCSFKLRRKGAQEIEELNKQLSNLDLQNWTMSLASRMTTQKTSFQVQLQVSSLNPTASTCTT